MTNMDARLNDAFRQAIGQGGHVYMTPGTQAFPPEDQLQVFNLVKTFNDFSEGNDPYGDRLFWKIDYYDNDLECGSEDPADPEKTVRVMMAWEY